MCGWGGDLDSVGLTAVLFSLLLEPGPVPWERWIGGREGWRHEGKRSGLAGFACCFSFGGVGVFLFFVVVVVGVGVGVVGLL